MPNPEVFTHDEKVRGHLPQSPLEAAPTEARVPGAA